MAPAKTRTKTTPRKGRPTPRRARSRRARFVTEEELEARTPGLFAYCSEHREGFRKELGRLRHPMHATPMPSTRARAAGAYFDVAAVAHFVEFCSKIPHVKGRRWARKRFALDLWQLVFIVAPLFGWKRADGTRYYRTLYLEVPRKNGKSTLAAAIALYLLAADREPGAEVYSAARDTEQARAVFDVAVLMVNGSPLLRSRLIPLGPSRIIKFPRTGSAYKVLSGEALSKHGLNIHGVVVDELHVIVDRELVNTLETGTGSRDQPLIIFITTAGIPDESPIWRDKRAEAIKVADAIIDRPDLLGVIYGAPESCALDGSWREPEVWAAANPGLGTSLRPDYIAGRAAAAENTPTELNSFLRLHLDVPTGSSAGWLPTPTWDRSASVVDESDLAGARGFGGLDLASSQDLAAFVAVFPDPSGTVLDVLCRFWTPKDTLAMRAHRDQADYERWAKEGFLIPTPGETIDFDQIEADIGAVLGAHDVVAINYDRWGSIQLRQHLQKAGARLWDMGQGIVSMSAPMKETEKLVVEKRLRHGGHPVLRWCIANTITSQDPAGNIKPDRKRSRSRIDGTVALVMAVDAWLRDVNRGQSAYEGHGLEIAR